MFTHLDIISYFVPSIEINQLVEEDTIQVFRIANRTEELILGVVGQLQFEVSATG